MVSLNQIVWRPPRLFVLWFSGEVGAPDWWSREHSFS